RVEVLIAQLDRAAQNRLAFEQCAGLDRLQHCVHRSLVLGGDLAEQPLGRELSRNELEVLRCNLQARLRQRKLDRVDERANARKTAVELPQDVDFSVVDETPERSATAEP